MPAPALITKTPKTYTALRSAVRRAIAAGEARARAAVEREKVRTVWQVGKLILNHVFRKPDRARYGAEVLKRLAADLGMSHTELGYMMEFAREYPISPPAGKLSWSHYRELLVVNDVTRRKAITQQAAANDWSRRELRAAIKKIKAKGKKKNRNAAGNTALKEPVLHKPGAYRTLKWQGKHVYDLGFSTYLEVRGRKPRKAKPKPSELYYYETELERVVDGDTVWMHVHLGFGVWTKQKLRLRGLNAPELRTTAGQEAKRYLNKLLKTGKPLVLRTVKADKYDRYLADLWAGGVYVNRALVAEGLASVLSV